MLRIFLIIAISCFSFPVHLFGESKNQSITQSVNARISQSFDNSYKKSLSDNDKKFLSALRGAIEKKVVAPELEKSLAELFVKTDFPKNAWGVGLVLYEPGKRRIEVIRTDGGVKGVPGVLKGLLKHKRFSSFNTGDRARCRLQVDFILHKPVALDIRSVAVNALDSRRFEFGVDGLLIKSQKAHMYFLPGDAFVKSILGFNQLDDYVRRTLKIKPEEPLSYETFRSQSMVSFGDDWLSLYRGFPVTVSVSRSELEGAAELAAENIIRYQDKEGRFLYYYDAANDSLVDHEHPKRNPKKNPYYNLIRHAGATMLLMKYYEKTKRPEILEHVRLALWYALRHLITYRLPDGQEASYLMDNNKAKLGGQGILLHVLCEYQRVSGDNVFSPFAPRIARHILTQILPGGEFMYYSIYLGKEVKPEDNSKLFGFYYPGEAVVGLASFLKSGAVTGELKAQIIPKLNLALDFLMTRRFEIYKDQFPSLPEDSWLIMGIQKLWSFKEFQREDLKAFVFKTADQVVGHMYTENDALFPDYPGAFYYTYGDEPYPDGARAEGLIAAYFFSKDVKNEAKEKEYYDALKKVTLALYRLVNNDKSLYSVPNPEKALGGIRFKPTRQWFRIDTTSHVANVFMDFAALM